MIQIQARESSNAGIKYYALSYKQDGAAGGFKFYKDVNHAWVLHKVWKNPDWYFSDPKHRAPIDLELWIGYE